ncbi:DNA replication licensing factor mcm7, partial [Fragariocoptes setiger]
MANNINYEQDLELAKQFLREYENGKYASVMEQLANREAIKIVIDLLDVDKFNHTLATAIAHNTMRYVQIFYEALDFLLPFYKTKDIDMSEKDPMDIFIEQRLLISDRNQRHDGTIEATPRGIDIEGKYPPDLVRRAELYFKPVSLAATPVRDVRAEHIGKLVTVRGIVTRTTDVKPKVTIVTYTCDQCGCESFQPVTGNDFMPLHECTSAACKSNKSLGRVSMQTRGSKFVKFQEIKLQEHSDQVPTGHIPRSITIMAHGETTRLCVPGDHISVSGVFLPIERTGFRMRSGGLTADTYIEAHNIIQMNKTEDDELDTQAMSMDEAAELFSSSQESPLQRLSSSIAPEIYGHDELKKALLLLLVGGVDRSPHGMKIRGNINICLMGDPGVAKSQLLGFIDRLAPRSQYTTGRGSSGVGLTAAVLRDPITNELVLEGGALVLADEGVCCIDEFDKMMDADRTAIHEVMEQQTVSIAKAGIMTTLNARVSILAAANPAYGRYNTSRSISDNLQLPPALLSRFDLLWLIKDRPEQQRDLNLAEHITYIHQTSDSRPPPAHANPENTLDMKLMRRYINLCKKKNPVIPEELTSRLVKIYRDIRSKKSTARDSMFTSPRSLLAIIRLSTAFARLRLSDVVEQHDIDSAVDLYNASRESIEEAIDDARISSDKEILRILNEIQLRLGRNDLPMGEVIEAVEAKGFSSDQLRHALSEYRDMDHLEFNDEYVTIVDS